MRTFLEVNNYRHSSTTDTYIFSIIPAADRQSFVYIASDDSINFVDVKADKGGCSSAPSGRVQSAHKGISCLAPVQATTTGSSFATAGRDGKVKLWECGNAGGTTFAKQVTEVSTPNGQAVSALAVYEQEKLLAAGTELEGNGPGDVAIYIWSFANPANLQLLRSYTESHTDTITSLRFHHASSPLTATTTTPSNPQLQLISSSTDGLVNIYDPSLSDEDDAVLVVFNNKAAVSHACPFLAAPTPTSPSAGGAPAICAISHDEKLSVYEIEDKSLKGEEEVTWPEVDVREALNADYAISLLPQTGRGESNGQTMMLAVGAYREETLAKVPGVTRPYVDLCMGAPKQAATQGSPPSSGFELAIRLVGGHGEEVVRDVWFDQEASFVVTCGEDGFIRIWADQNGPAPLASGDVVMEGTTEETTPSSKESKRKKKHKEKRFKPY